jgi:hypothetical protein
LVGKTKIFAEKISEKVWGCFEMKKYKCIFWFWKENRCDSKFGKGIPCDGSNPPKNCPYKFGVFIRLRRRK